MSIIDSMNSAIKGTAAWLRGSPEVSVPAYQRTTTASRRAATPLRYSHVSKEIGEGVKLALHLDLPGLASNLLRKTKGTTLVSHRGILKRAADQLAVKHDMPDKTRRRMRAAMRREMAQRLATA